MCKLYMAYSSLIQLLLVVLRAFGTSYLCNQLNMNEIRRGAVEICQSLELSQIYNLVPFCALMITQSISLTRYK
jgi:hypothetical protein